MYTLYKVYRLRVIVIISLTGVTLNTCTTSVSYRDIVDSFKCGRSLMTRKGNFY